MTLAALLRWFAEHQDQVPVRIHARGVWSDPADGVGSALGAPALHREFRDYTERSGWAVRREMTEGPCSHPLRRPGLPCPSCSVVGADGRVIAESGRARGERLRYRWPMRAAIARCAGAPVPAGHPRLDVVLDALAAARGEASLAASTLARAYPIMGDRAAAVRHVTVALAACRSRYRDEPPGRPVPATVGRASEAQLDAEAVAWAAAAVHRSTWRAPTAPRPLASPVGGPPVLDRIRDVGDVAQRLARQQAAQEVALPADRDEVGAEREHDEVRIRADQPDRPAATGQEPGVRAVLVLSNGE